MPFLTEELWHKLPKHHASRSIALEHYPEAREDWRDLEAEQEMADLQEIAERTRNLQAEGGKQSRTPPPSILISDDDYIVNLLTRHQGVLSTSTRAAVELARGPAEPPLGALVSTSGRYSIYLREGPSSNKQAEAAKVKKEIERLAKDIESKQARLSDEVFLSKAPAKIVDDLKATLATRQLEHGKLVDRLKQLE